MSHLMLQWRWCRGSARTFRNLAPEKDTTMLDCLKCGDGGKRHRHRQVGVLVRMLVETLKTEVVTAPG